MRKSGGVNPAQILGAASGSSNAVTPAGDYEGHWLLIMAHLSLGAGGLFDMVLHAFGAQFAANPSEFGE